MPTAKATKAVKAIQGKKPTKASLAKIKEEKINLGIKPTTDDVEGQEFHHGHHFARCWNCGQGNHVAPFHHHFICHSCGTMNHIHYR